MVGIGVRTGKGRQRQVVSAGAQVRVLLGAPQLMLRQALTAVLSGHPRLRVVGDVGSGKDALRWALEVRPDVTLLDEGLSRVDGVHAATILHLEAPQLSVVTLTDGGTDRSEADEDDVVAARISKRLGTQALVDVLLRVAEGEHPGNVPALVRALPRRRPRVPGDDRLRASERALLELLAEGSDNRVLAERLGCTEKTVRNRLSDLYAKLNLRNRTQAALYAVRVGIADPGEIGEA